VKILICHRPSGAFGYISDGWINALRDKGHVVQRWDGHEQSWRAFGPQLYVGCSGHRQPIPPRHAAQIAIHVNPYGPVNIGGINESDEAIRWTLNQKPHAVFGYGQEQDRLLWSYWTSKHGIPWVPMPTAGDRTVYRETTTDKTYDAVYLGGRWPYKAKTIDAYLMPAIEGLNYKIHGWGDWPAGISSGELSDDQVAGFLSSGKIGPCISEQHTHSHGIDIPERAFKVALCGGVVVHDAALSLKSMIPNALIAANPSNFRDICHLYCQPSSEEARIELAAQQKAEVLAAHTYHHRMAALLAALGHSEEAKGMLA